MLVFSPTEIKAEATETSSSQREITTEKDLNQAPVIEVVAEPRTGEAPLEVFFDTSNSYDPDGSIENYQWDFKDGDKATGKEVNHTFNSSGTYKVELTIIDNEGAETTISKIIIVRS